MMKSRPETKPAADSPPIHDERTLSPEAIDAIAAAISPVFDETGRRARAVCVVDDEQFHRIAFGLDLMRRKSEPVGPRFRRPRPTVALADKLNEPIHRAHGVVHRHLPELDPAAIAAADAEGADLIPALPEVAGAEG